MAVDKRKQALDVQEQQKKTGDASPFAHITHRKKRRFLEAYAFEADGVLQAAEIAGCNRRSHYWWRANDEEYRKAFELAEEIRADRLEAEAFRRARETSDTMLIFLLKGAKPHKYREHYEISGPGGNPLKIIVSHLNEEVFGYVGGNEGRSD